ncbi:Rrf2 family transcriptional regulator, partial [Salmonella enterica subsp. enterica serovar Heidelberg]|nr:Rrf2 family transcriptional regulator [Salmonella enterica subsp. enterica serovar Heidelberg]
QFTIADLVPDSKSYGWQLDAQAATAST